jgi:L-ascorbate metabolism protein UlaG (beta-lactamase superfamily)
VTRPPHHKPEGGFRNPPGSPRQTATLRDFLRFLLIDMRRAKVPSIPPGHVAPTAPDLAALPDDHVAWLGHACFALRLGGKLVLTDPYLGMTAGPFGFGPKRFVAPAIAARDLPRIDLIVLSHNHYDHLDSGALRDYRFKAETPIACPLGLASTLRKAGFATVIEMDWWQHRTIAGLDIACLPAVHFSGRGPFDRNMTLWASFGIRSATTAVWFGGDSADGAVFAEIGAREGPFDLALVGIGAYEPRAIMQASHANPEEAIAIARAVRARRALGSHWGTVMLTPEDPFEAPERFRRAAQEVQYGEGNAFTLPIGGIAPI